MKEIIIRDKAGKIDLRFSVTDLQLEIAKKLGIDEMTYIKKYTELMYQNHKERQNEAKGLHGRSRRSGKADQGIQPQTSDSARIDRPDDNQGSNTGGHHQST